MVKPRDLISKYMLDQNKELHETQKYGESGHKNADNVLGILVGLGGTPSMLDYGCGKSWLRIALQEMNWQGEIREYDPALKGFDALPSPANVVTCTDVLEHIEPGLLDNVLKHIRSLTIDVCYLNIATRPANKILPNGMNAHLIVESPKWWWKRVRKHWATGYWVGVEKKGAPHEVKLWLKP